MNNQDYLDQITASTKPSKIGSGITSIIPPLALKFIIGGVALAILIIIFGAIFGNMGTKSEDIAKQLSVRLKNVSATIEKYNPETKSSQLRQLGSSTNSVLSDTKRSLDDFLLKKYNYKKPDEKSKMYTDETAHIEKVNNELEYARLNAFLDRYYVRQLLHQIELILSMESDINARTDNTDLINIMNNSAHSLTEIHTKIEKTAETIK